MKSRPRFTAPPRRVSTDEAMACLPRGSGPWTTDSAPRSLFEDLGSHFLLDPAHRSASVKFVPISLMRGKCPSHLPRSQSSTCGTMSLVPHPSAFVPTKGGIAQFSTLLQSKPMKSQLWQFSRARLATAFFQFAAVKSRHRAGAANPFQEPCGSENSSWSVSTIFDASN
jgi:hypothetical protein